MYTVCGANLHGQWFDTNPILNEFQTISRKTYYDGSLNQEHLILNDIRWSYNIFHNQNTKKFILSGCWEGKNNQLIELPLPKNVSTRNILICGNDYSLFLFEINLHIIWIFSLEDTENVKIINLKTEMPTTIKRLKCDDVIVKVCVSNYYCICLTAGGNVYSGSLPGPLDVSNCLGRVCDVECGYEHHLLLTDTGRVYSWGNGRRLQLGHGDLSNLDTPKQIEALGGINITKISAGGWHSLALSDTGDLYAWGWNEKGQLGIKEIVHKIKDQSGGQNSLHSQGLPTLVDIFDENGDIVNVNVKYISCGNLHSALMLQDDSVWTTGCNKYGQLGLSTETTKQVCYYKNTYQCSNNSLIKCGPWATVISPVPDTEYPSK